jgi:predicted RNase H-like HicB family nuclease
MNNITFLVNAAEEGGYNAHAESESIYTQADTLEDIRLNIADAIQCYFDDDVLPGFVLKFV